MSKDRFARRFGGVVALAGSMLLALPVQASVITAIDEFVITRDPLPVGVPEPGVFYRDSFSDGVEPPSGGSFFNGAAGTYSLTGTFANGDEANGKLTLDSSRGGAFINAAGTGRLAQLTTLQTDIDPSTQAGLKRAFHTFTVSGLFNLVLPPTIGDSYGIYVNDAGPSGRTESIDLVVRREENNSIVIRFHEQDFLGGVVNTIELDTLDIPTDATQIELLLQREDLATNALTASYRLWVNGSANPLFTDMSASASFFTNNDWARGGFFALQALPLQAVPEPSTVALLLLGLVGLGVARKQRR
jgi:PEP-CTERM motif